MKKVLLFCWGLLPLCWSQAQELVFAEPQKLPDVINSAAEESLPLLSPDGHTLFFTRFMHEANVGGKYSGQDVWTSEFNGREWSHAGNLNAVLNHKNNNAVVGISTDGKVIYMLNSSATRELKGIYFSKNLNGVWTTPELVPIEGISNQGFVGFHVSADFEVILISMKSVDTRGEEDLYVSLKNKSGQWQKPKNLGPTINTSGFEISPFLSADKKRLYFASNGHSGMGDADIFYSDKLYDSWETWSTPKNLGKTINTPSFDGYFSIAGDSLALFSSNRNSQHGDLYITRIDKAKPATSSENSKQFLTAQEVSRLLSGSVETRLFFAYDSITLTRAHERQLANISSRLLSHRDLKFHIVALKSPDTPLEKYQKRLLGVLNYLKKSGIEGSKVTFGSEIDNLNDGQSPEVILIKFYR